MKKLFSKSILLICFLLLFVSSCKKESAKTETIQEQKTSTNSAKDTIPPKKDNAITEKEVKLSGIEQKKLNIYFSNFSEAYLEPFTNGNISDDEMIKFGILHNHKNNFKLFEKAGENKLKIKDALVSKSIEKYFGKIFTTHKSIQDYKYKDGYYFIPDADGEAYTFSQVEKLSDIGNDKYIAYINIYTASSGWTGDNNANPEKWKKDANEMPELTSKFKATFSKTNSQNGEEVYKLIDYIRQ